MAGTSLTLTIAITPNGHLRSHLLQPVQHCALCSTECLRQPFACKLSTCGGQTATHQPQPVQRGVSICGKSMGRPLQGLGRISSTVSVGRHTRTPNGVDTMGLWIRMGC